MTNLPRITFGIIVLNGEPFTCYTLRALYPFAHEIIVAEGAALTAAGVATPDGHSKDGTLDTLRDFKAREDPDNKLIIITAEDEGHPDGFWPGEKHEQSQAYAKRTTGDYLWQIDVDEFYRPQDMRAVLELIKSDPTITAISFASFTFWGGFDYLVDGWYLRTEGETIHRIFKWAPGYFYVTHRPPTVLDEQNRNLHLLNWINGKALARRGIFMYHYSLVFPKQVSDKNNYYSRAEWADRGWAAAWPEEVFMNLRQPYHVHNVTQYPSWLEPFKGTHPPQIEALRADLKAGSIDIALRPTLDIDRLLKSKVYQVGRFVLWALIPVAPIILWSYVRLKVLIQEPTVTLRRWVKKYGHRLRYLFGAPSAQK